MRHNQSGDAVSHVFAPSPDGAAATTGGLNHLVGYLLRRAQLRLSAELAVSLSPLGLRPVTFSVLAVISESPGLSQAELGDRLGIKRANVVPIASELERMRWIERRPSVLDRRRNVLHLTVEGRRLLKRGWRVVIRQEDRIAQRVGAAGRRQLRGILESLAAEEAPLPARVGESAARTRRRASSGSAS